MTLLSGFDEYVRKKGKEVRRLANAKLTVEKVEAGVAGQKILFQVDVEQRAAWKLYVELNTRVATQSLGEYEGALREALSSLHEVFGVTREILKEAGPAVAMQKESLGFFAMQVLNKILRPFLSKWHPELSCWEQQRKPEVSPLSHEAKWDRARELRQGLAQVRKQLLLYSASLGALAGIHNS